MNILVLGDVVSESGCNFVRKRLPALKRLYGVDLCVANAENSAKGNGVTPDSARFLFSSGVDALTLGNHAFRRKEVYSFLDENEAVVRPFNFPAGAPGRGTAVLDLGRVRVAVVNLMGTMYLDALDNPFNAVEEALKQTGDAKIVLVDFHAEATSEKRAMGFYLDGRVSAVWGTHTHVQTSDAEVLPNGTGYITDLGMTGAANSVLGIDPQQSIGKFLGDPPRRYASGGGPCKMECAVFELDCETGKCTGAQALRIE